MAQGDIIHGQRAEWHPTISTTSSIIEINDNDLEMDIKKLLLCIIICRIWGKRPGLQSLYEFVTECWLIYFSIILLPNSFFLVLFEYQKDREVVLEERMPILRSKRYLYPPMENKLQPLYGSSERLSCLDKIVCPYCRVMGR